MFNNIFYFIFLINNTLQARLLNEDIASFKRAQEQAVKDLKVFKMKTIQKIKEFMHEKQPATRLASNFWGAKRSAPKIAVSLLKNHSKTSIFKSCPITFYRNFWKTIKTRMRSAKIKHVFDFSGGELSGRRFRLRFVAPLARRRRIGLHDDFLIKI